jgi:hypothetical protein
MLESYDVTFNSRRLDRAALTGEPPVEIGVKSLR